MIRPSGSRASIDSPSSRKRRAPLYRGGGPLAPLRGTTPGFQRLPLRGSPLAPSVGTNSLGVTLRIGWFRGLLRR